MKYQSWLGLLISIVAVSAYAANDVTLVNDQQKELQLKRLPTFFRFSFDDLSMPGTERMGLLGLNYFADITPYIYGGIGAYGAVTGTQGGLFTLGVAGGVHHEFYPHWWGDAGLFAGGGGGRSSLVGGGLMVRPYVGVAYEWSWARLGLHYSYINFPDGKIHSKQVGVDLDIPTEFYYLDPGAADCFDLKHFKLLTNDFLNVQRNDFAILLQNYIQRTGTLNTEGNVQDGTISLVGAELDHYFTDHMFWWLKAAGAFSGIPNGYMDVLGGLGYHWAFFRGLALVPQLGIGAGGGGMVNTGGGFIINPQLGIEWPIFPSLSMRVISGYMWAPNGDFKVVPITGELIYHLNFVNGTTNTPNRFMSTYAVQGWRIQAMNQTYTHPQRSFNDVRTDINMVAVQIDQLLTPFFFLSYQGAAAYSGYHAGGYATGLIGPGIQSSPLFNEHVQLFSEVLVGAGGGGGLSLSGGSLIEPLVGLRYAFTPIVGVQASVGELKALRDDLDTPVINVGLTIRFDTLNGLC